MTLEELLTHHPAPWRCHDHSVGCVTDAKGGTVFIAVNGLSIGSQCDGWEFAQLVVKLVNAAAEAAP